MEAHGLPWWNVAESFLGPHKSGRLSSTSKRADSHVIIVIRCMRCIDMTGKDSERGRRAHLDPCESRELTATLERDGRELPWTTRVRGGLFGSETDKLTSGHYPLNP
ncbi:hypothetical protein CRG98_018790 [Punica granatum]|uniref:Uncharacterized protein n=1 Tax=Punica granatum TaxID=22663 RepID=A0A2I0JWX8_PUNGR|nr:hypothetical protein CRG98_018790 [Punica granatum]